jgi:hypothetical protein
MPAPPDRLLPDSLELVGPVPFPLGPLNVQVSSALFPGALDIRWTSPTELSPNTCLSVVGVNIYRSFDSKYGPYFRINPVPLGSTFWRDQPEVTLALQEDVTQAFTSRGAPDDVKLKWTFRTKHSPIVIYPSPGNANCTDLNVQVLIYRRLPDGSVNPVGEAAHVQVIYAEQGIIEIDYLPTFDVVNQIQKAPVLPGPDDIVLATYRYISKEVPTNLFQRTFYRVTTVSLDSSTGRLIETPLERGSESNRDEVEKLDYIWREAIRRNRWILNQGGERVKIFIRKSIGIPCGCISDTHRHPAGDCLTCYGTGIIGGYEGPYDTIIAPDDAERAITRQNRGLAAIHTYETWTGPNPLLSQRDFIVKLNGDRYGIGPVRMPSNRGNQLQQHFNIAHLDEKDIRYRVPLPDTRMMISPATRWIDPGHGTSTPMMTEKVNTSDDKELRGRTVTFENIG